MASPNLFVFFFVFHPLLLKFCDANKCPKSFSCRNLESLKYPLTDHEHPECGLIHMYCNYSVPRFQLGDEGSLYDVLDYISTTKYFVRDKSLQFNLDNQSCFSFRSIPPYISSNISFVISPNITIFKCEYALYDSSVEEHFKDYKNHSECNAFTVYYRNPEDGNLTRGTDLPLGCSSIQLPTWDHPVNWSDDLFELVAYEYNIEWHVEVEQTQGKSKKNVIVVAGASVAALIVATSFILLVFFKKKLLKSLGFQKTYAKDQVDIELFLKNHGTLAPKMYKYSHLKKITNSFSENLGKGGYGIVYKGKLQDGRLVAVKILSESKGNGEEFINEVSSISRTSHVNVVALLGFCFDGLKRALIYEFMPNGSLEKFIPNTSSAPNSSLGVEKLFEIVVGIARGLEYLHQGCNTRILHFDIKPHNILLDKDYKPKISDFGLSKLCPNRSSIVLMQETRGTVGYIAPEVFCRNFGEVSHKSDVYSYGMMVLEMVVGRQQHNIDPQGEHSSEIYFSDWIYKNLEQNTIEKGIVDTDISQEDEQNFVKRRLIIIGLWCIQSDPKNRPSISGVIEMLEAKLESLQVPPRTYLSSSPPILPLIYSCSESKSLL